ncbi:Disease resistance protein RGA2 [Ananas comosus]|uniref:Disease resistance protein RGA2 n=1 Tax=Ananas comosus TaxID=4615 RepID=A0A199VVM5_ANACO|nr:Disease resistance protein RGA2 [Ananas comosus]
MGWLLSFAKEVVQSAAASVVADELVRLLPCLDHDLEVLRTTLLTTRLRVDNAEQWRFKNAHFDQLLMQLKAAYYDAEDLIAEFDYVELQQKIEGQASLLLSSSLDFVKNLISRAPDKVRQYQRRLDDAAAALEKVIVDLNFRDEPKRSDVLRRRQTGSFVTEPEVFGRDEEREKVIALLLRPGDESGRPSNSESVPAKRMKTDNVSVLPIVGIGGMGKTTLAQVVFNDPRVRHYFETRIWICVSEIFDVKRLTKEVISNVDLRHQTDGKNSSLSRTNRKNLTLYQTGGKNFSSLQVVLNEIATSKRFLLVLDDVWNEDKMEWDKFYAPMRSGYRGSMILTTTRSSKVADIMGTMDSIFLEGLPDDSFWEFFKTCAFGYGNEKLNQELESIAKKIATKLKGTPLAAKTVGGLLKEKMDANHWRSIMNSEMWKLRQDYEIDEVSLIELWVAQGFVTSEDNMLPKDVATRYLAHEVLMVQNNKCEQSSPSSVRHLAILGSYLESSMLKEIELRSLGGSGALTSLQELTILECPRLTETEPMMYVNRVWRKDDPITAGLVTQLDFFTVKNDRLS